jgi:hypothetical protein
VATNSLDVGQPSEMCNKLCLTDGDELPCTGGPQVPSNLMNQPTS